MGWKVQHYEHPDRGQSLRVVDQFTGRTIVEVGTCPGPEELAIGSLIAAAPDFLALANAVIRAERSWPRTGAERVIIDLAHQAEIIVTRASMPHVAKMGEAVDQMRAGNTVAAELTAAEALSDPAAEFFGVQNSQLLAMCEGRLLDRRIVGGLMVEQPWPPEFLKAAAVELRRRLTFV